jgi:hypothetical protein
MQSGAPRGYRGPVSVPDAPVGLDPAPEENEGGHLRRALGGTKELVRIAWRDPAHIPERLTLHAAQNLAGPSSEWAERAQRNRPDATRREIADDLREQSIKIARVDGAIAGTPFFIALVPGYISYLWQEARMGLRTAALFGHDPTSMHTAAEMLTLRGVHPTVAESEKALLEVADTPVPPKVTQRRSLRTWVNAIRYVLIFGGFLGPPDEGEKPSGVRDRLRAAAGLLVGFLIWALTWIVPVTFMIALAWGCETHARQLGLRTLKLYAGEAATTDEAIDSAEEHYDEGRTKRQVVRSLLLTLSVALPIGFIVYADSVRQTTGVTWVGALGALVALSVVIAGAVYGSRR